MLAAHEGLLRVQGEASDRKPLLVLNRVTKVYREILESIMESDVCNYEQVVDNNINSYKLYASLACMIVC